jgi:hypothetical protein
MGPVQFLDLSNHLANPPHLWLGAAACNIVMVPLHLKHVQSMQLLCKMMPCQAKA